ncbi:transglutaminase TgpA family protein [Rhizohabitans arisaemae]|uniref:transglutaminase TgpA family protein n=1 Tax=Rhizohabitans arisaemae TaxID=2720610 RepID=UPI0024B16D8E|nr:DUF3488 and transglutaminase-like domain-containing protein [Rhizohabitans arisaemae]
MKLPIAAVLATTAVTLSLYPLIDGADWFLAALGAVLVVIGTATLAGRLSIPPALASVPAAIALLLYLTVTHAGEEAWGGFVPTTTSLLRLAEIAAKGFDEIQNYPAPVPASPGVILLTVGGVGVIALLVDLLAIRLRRAALSGLPLLGLFTVPAAISTAPIGWPVFILGAVGYVVLLVVDGRERVRRWGKPVLLRRNPGSAGPDVTRLAVTGKRIGVAAVGLAVVVPAMLPSLTPNPIFAFGVGEGPGGNTVTFPNPIASLRGNLNLPVELTVMTYQNNDSIARYLRIYSLDVFDGTQWTMTPPQGRAEDRISEGPLPPPEGLSPDVQRGRIDSRIRIDERVKQLSFLPMPYPPTEVEADGDWRADAGTLMVFSTQQEAGGLGYRVVGLDVRPTREQLRAAGRPSPALAERYLALPPDLPADIQEKAREVTGAERTAYDKAVALQNWFTKPGNFTYSLATQGQSGQALSDFVMRGRTGYCEQFAGAMAVMARVLGIPARVAVGYTGGSFNQGNFAVSTRDTHAWPELYFEGAGWLRFEPTPSTGQGTASTPGYTRPEVTGGPTNNQSASSQGSTDPSAAPTPGSADNRENRDPDALNRPVGAPVAVDEGLGAWAWAGAGVLATAAVLLLPAGARVAQRALRRRRVRRQAPGSPAMVVTVWAELSDTLTDLGIPRLGSESPRSLARRLAERCTGRSPAADPAEALERIARAQERLRYAPSLPADLTGQRLDADLRTVRSALLAAAGRAERFRARFAPPSVLRRLRRAGTGLLDAFDRLESIRLRPRRAEQ